MRKALVLVVIAALGCSNPKRSADAQVRDEEITRDIMMALHRNERFADIRVTCKQGVVTLDGIVTREADREEATGVAWGVSGVQDVRTLVKLRSR